MSSDKDSSLVLDPDRLKELIKTPHDRRRTLARRACVARGGGRYVQPFSKFEARSQPLKPRMSNQRQVRCNDSPVWHHRGGQCVDSALSVLNMTVVSARVDLLCTPGWRALGIGDKNA